MKFEEYKVITDQHGFKFAKNGIMVGDEERACMVCLRPTKFIEVCSEVNLCSDECVEAFYRMSNDAVSESMEE